MKKTLCVALVSLCCGLAAAADTSAWDLGKKVLGKSTVGPLEKQINQTLLEQSRQNQCAFKSDSDELEGGCDAKATKLAQSLIDAKKKLNNAGVRNFKFEVSGHTDSSGSAARNKALSEKRAAVMKRELVKKGVPESEIVVVGAGSTRPLVTPDDTPAKKAKNRRYEVRVRL